ncbi:multicopper oxidase domain-containing protein [Agrobacterium rubi]
MRFLGWPGKTVFHCHILPHEDTGMMQNILVLGDQHHERH